MNRFDCNKFPMLTHGFEISFQAVRNYLKLTCEYKLHIVSDTKVGAVKDHCENYMKVKPLLVSHLLRNPLLKRIS